MQERIRFFLKTETVLYLCILFNISTGALEHSASGLLCLASIFLCLLHAVSWMLDMDSFHAPFFYLTAALVFSLCADYFLILTDDFLAGLILFAFAQICYCLLLGRPLKSILLTALAFLAPLSVLIFNQILPSDPLLLFSFFYASLLCGNIGSSLKQKKYWLALGLFLLLLCDLHVGIFNLPYYFDLSKMPFLAGWADTSTLLIWLFYVPAQTMLSLMAPGAAALKCPDPSLHGHPEGITVRQRDNNA